MSFSGVTETTTIAVEELSQVAAARRAARRLGEELGFAEARLGNVELAVSEAASNIFHHAGQGHIALTPRRDGGAAWLEVLALDHGPGIRQLGRALAGEAPKEGSLGQGLGAIRRLADRFAIFAPPDRGTAVLAHFGRPKTPAAGLISGICRPLAGQAVCGDGWAARQMPGGRTLLLVLDGVGHGPDAHDAMARGIVALARLRRPDPVQLLTEVHRALHGTRGAAGLAVLFDPRDGTFRGTGIGNLQSFLVHEGERKSGIVSLNGTLGAGHPRIREFTGEWSPDGLFVVQTDGISARWTTGDHPGLWRQDTGLVAGVLFRDHAWPHDDSTVIVVRCPESVEVAP